MAFEANADGSTKRMFAQATGINAVWVIDWNKRQVVDMLWPPKLPLWKQNADGIQTGDMHGLEVLPDRSAVWASSRLDSRIYGWTLPDLKYIGAVEVGPTANWMTPTPDSRFMYVAISGSDHTLAVDLKKLEIVAKIKTGARPARISTAILPLRPRQHRPGRHDSAERQAGVAAMTREQSCRRGDAASLLMAGVAAFVVVSLTSSHSAESRPCPGARDSAAAAPRAGRRRVVPEHHRADLHARSRRHDAGLRGLRDVPHVADEPAVRPRDAGHRRRMDARSSRGATSRWSRSW